ncbi:MAG: 4-hydroxy-3-methylbut-2-enyl diphosphate reductase [Proteobacteria bacterium]|nr:4-hydroxy-3-methylbut-2-enyl diphosphate reductase [Pseudomonadota bacterium]
MQNPPTESPQQQKLRVIKINPRGYCYGVVDAIQLARVAARDEKTPKPIYILGQIVHNRHAVNSLNDYGIISLDGENREELLEQVDHGTVVFTAHGVSPIVKLKARARGLHIIDATCPEVTHTHELVKTLVAQGYEIIYIGRKGHPEPEGVIGEAPDHVHLVEKVDDVERLDLGTDKIAVSTQTTLSKWDTEKITEAIRARFPHALIHNDICSATTDRQEAAVVQSKDADLVLVVGDTKSNNSNRLVQVVNELAGKPAFLIDNVTEIQPEWFEGVRTVALTSGSSTPSQITREVADFLGTLYAGGQVVVPANSKVAREAVV